MLDTIFNLVELVNQLIADVSTSPWFLLLVFAIAFADSVIPVAPSEFAVIAGGVAASGGDLIEGRTVVAVLLVILFGSLGAFSGDSMAYWLGRSSGRFAHRFLFRGEKGQQRLRSAGAQIRRRGTLLLLTVRFIPGGRTATTFGCGLTRQPFKEWFARWDVVATTIWAAYAALLGYFVADQVDDHSTALWLVSGLALTLTVVAEVVRWGLGRRRGTTAA